MWLRHHSAVALLRSRCVIIVIHVLCHCVGVIAVLAVLALQVHVHDVVLVGIVVDVQVACWEFADIGYHVHLHVGDELILHHLHLLRLRRLVHGEFLMCDVIGRRRQVLLGYQRVLLPELVGQQVIVVLQFKPPHSETVLHIVFEVVFVRQELVAHVRREKRLEQHYTRFTLKIK